MSRVLLSTIPTLACDLDVLDLEFSYEGESISNQPNLFLVEIHLFFFDVIAL